MAKKFVDAEGLGVFWGRTKGLTTDLKNKLVNGDVTVQKATKDASGNTITATYATKNELSTQKDRIDGLLSGDGTAVDRAVNDGDGNAITSTYIKINQRGAKNGVATLDSNGHVPSSQLPSFVDDVIEGYYYQEKFYAESAHTTLLDGEGGKIYVDLSTMKTYRWGGSAYVIISDTLAIGTTAGTAFDGAAGKSLSNRVYTVEANVSGMHFNVQNNSELIKEMHPKVQNMVESIYQDDNIYSAINNDGFGLGFQTLSINSKINKILDFFGKSIVLSHMTDNVINSRLALSEESIKLVVKNAEETKIIEVTIGKGLIEAIDFSLSIGKLSCSSGSTCGGSPILTEANVLTTAEIEAICV